MTVFKSWNCFLTRKQAPLPSWIKQGVQRSGCNQCISSQHTWALCSSGRSRQRTANGCRRHCACSRQLNMNFASRLKTSHLQVRISSVYYFDGYFSLAYRSSVVCCRGNSYFYRRFCVLNAPLFHKFHLKSLHIHKLQDKLQTKSICGW